MTMVGVALAVVFNLSGCSVQPGKVTPENYDRLNIGMKREEVVEIMGPAQRSYPKFGMKQFTWVEGERHIYAKFVGGVPDTTPAKTWRAPVAARRLARARAVIEAIAHHSLPHNPPARR